jgi:hypothetical protein
MVVKLAAIMTSDFRLYHGLVKEMNRAGMRYISLEPGEEVPPYVGLVITSKEEYDSIDFQRKIWVSDPEKGVKRALVYLTGTDRCNELVIGIDPGKKPGIAIICDGKVVEKTVAMSPEGCYPIVFDAVSSREYGSAKIRIGHGDLTNRNRTIIALRPLEIHMELVDESNTTRLTKNDDEDAAVSIAFTEGIEISEEYAISPTDGEIREIQRRSRMESKGHITIGKALARKVAMGKMSMEDAIRIQRRRNEEEKP